jgi:hypothetical protein
MRRFSYEKEERNGQRDKAESNVHALSRFPLLTHVPTKTWKETAFPFRIRAWSFRVLLRQHSSIPPVKSHPMGMAFVVKSGFVYKDVV